MTKRRTKGVGSVYKRGNGRIVGEYEDANGKKRYVSGKTKPDVRHKLRKVLEGDAGIVHDSEGLSIERYMDRQLDSVRDEVRPAQAQQDTAIRGKAADFIDDKLKGFGPRQSRNLLQGLGLTKHEIHIDGRITRWLNEFGLPVALSPSLPSYLRQPGSGARAIQSNLVQAILPQ